MAWNYRKRVTIAPGVRLNISKKGVSSTFGMRGASINVGKNGTYLNTGIPGTGIYSRRKIGENINYNISDKTQTDNGSSCIIGLFVGVVFAFIIGIVVSGLEDYKFLGKLLSFGSGVWLLILIGAIIRKRIINSSLVLSAKAEKEFQQQIETAKNVLNQATDPIQKEILQNFISCAELSRKADETEAIIEAIKQKTEKKTNSKLEEQIVKYETELSKIIVELENVQLDADKDLDEVEKWKFSKLCESFEKLLTSEKVWQIIFSIRNTELKSSASDTVERKEVNFDTGVFNYIKSSFDIPILRDLSGNTYYIYPRYIIKVQSFTNFEVVPIDTINLRYSKQRFIEDSILPEDSYAVDYTYQYVNKNGGPDKRFSYNPRLPIVEYGKIEIEKLGLTYHISKDLYAYDFVNAYNIWQNKSSDDKISPTQYKSITEEYFDQINNATEKLLLFYNKLKEDKEFFTIARRHLNESYQTAKDSDIIYMLFCIDLKICYDKLQIPVDFSTKEGLGFSIFTKRALGLGELKYNQLDILLNLDKDYHKQVLELINSANLQGNLKFNFTIADLLSVKDIDLMKQYLILLYRFVSITAKADGTVTEIEQKWLSELLNLSNVNNDIFVIDSLMDEEDESNDFSHIDLPIRDPLFEDAAHLIVAHQLCSTALIQRSFPIGYNRAWLIMEQLENAGIVEFSNNYTTRKVLINNENDLETLLKRVAPKSPPKRIKQQKEKSERVYPILNSTSQEELKSLIGLSSVKKEIETLTNFIKIQQERQLKGLKISQPSYHCVFTGNPGTGKTTVARIVAEIYKELGVLEKGHLVETDRSGLVAEYVGQTAVKTNKIIDSALDGVLFIDEAYSLISGSENDYGKEAIATLLKRMEDDRDRLVVILAGYSEEMQSFIDSNPGLQSRFNRYIEFVDFSNEELYEIFELYLKQFDYVLAKDAKNPLQELLTKAVINKDKNFGNARFVRNLFEKTIERQANRLSKEVNLTNEKLSEIYFVDIPSR